MRFTLCAVSAVFAGSLVACAALAGNRGTAAIQFDFKDPKGVNAVGIFVDSKLEPIRGFATGVSGVVGFDPGDPASFGGAISVDAGKIHLSSGKMTDVLRGADWLDVKNHLSVEFAFDRVVGSTVTDDGHIVLDVKGRLTVAGVTVEKQVPIRAAYLKDAASERGAAASGDLLVLRSQFVVERDAFNIRKGEVLDKVGNEIQIDVAIVGYSK